MPVKPRPILSSAQRDTLERLADPGATLYFSDTYNYWPSPSGFSIMPSTVDHLKSRGAIEPVPQPGPHVAVIAGAIQEAASAAKHQLEAGRYGDTANSAGRAARLVKIRDAEHWRISPRGWELLKQSREEDEAQDKAQAKEATQ